MVDYFSDQENGPRARTEQVISATALTASGARRPEGPEASGIKAAWPRLGTRRGATPASPTAVRRDVRQCFSEERKMSARQSRNAATLDSSPSWSSPSAEIPQTAHAN